MNKLDWAKHHGFDSSTMDMLEYILTEFNGKIVAINPLTKRLTTVYYS